VLAAVAVVVAIFECGARIAASGLDYDRAHIAKFPEISKRLDESPGPRILFLGNSLMRHGVVLDEVRAELRRLGVERFTVERVVPVGTDVTDWLYIYKRFFINSDRTPDIVVLGFVRHHTVDLKPPKRLRRLGRHFLDLRDAPECFAHDVRGFDDQAALLASRYWATFGDQLIYRERTLYALLPGFQSSEKRLNRILTRRKEAAAARNSRPAPEPTFERLDRLAELLKDSGADGIFAAMPLPHIWAPYPQVQKTVESRGMTYVDARKIDGVGPDDFPDGYHMGENAKIVYSRFIAARLAERIAASGARPADR